MGLACELVDKSKSGIEKQTTNLGTYKNVVYETVASLTTGVKISF